MLKSKSNLSGIFWLKPKVRYVRMVGTLPINFESITGSHFHIFQVCVRKVAHGSTKNLAMAQLRMPGESQLSMGPNRLYSLYVHYMFIICSLYVHYMFISITMGQDVVSKKNDSQK